MGIAGATAPFETVSCNAMTEPGFALFETAIAKMRVFRVPEFLGAALMLGLLASQMSILPALARPLQSASQDAEGHRRDAPGDAIEFIVIPNLQAATIRQALGPDVSAIDVKSALDRACRDGIASASVDVAHLYELEKETWAPTSERSRAQAGFQASLGGHAKPRTAAP